jgi:predicted phosphate transport protein (TIGR00153 family)
LAATVLATRDYTRNISFRSVRMGIGSVLKFFLPQDDKFLPFFEQSADNLREAANLYAGLARANNHEELAAKREEIKKLEHIGDKLTHQIFEELNKSFITPFDREDIYSLTKSMDDVLDLIDHVADILLLYRIEKLDEGMVMLLEVTRRAVNDIHKSIHSLRKIDYEKIREQIISVHALENEGDRLYRHFIGGLYANETDAIRLMKYSSIYNELEQTIDKCEDLMNAIESIVLKQA